MNLTYIFFLSIRRSYQDGLTHENLPEWSKNSPQSSYTTPKMTQKLGEEVWSQSTEFPMDWAITVNHLPPPTSPVSAWKGLLMSKECYRIRGKVSCVFYHRLLVNVLNFVNEGWTKPLANIGREITYLLVLDERIYSIFHW